MKFSRANFMVPVPVAASFDELNAHLAERCLARQAERAGRHADTIGERLVADTQALRPLPAVPLEPCEKRSARVSSTALVRYLTNDYSVPTAYAFQEVLVKGFVEEVVTVPLHRHRRTPAASIELNTKSGDPDFVNGPLRASARSSCCNMATSQPLPTPARFAAAGQAR